MKITGKKILAELKGDKMDREKITLYMSKSVYKNFRTACGDVPVSKVLEAIMKAFLKSLH